MGPRGNRGWGRRDRRARWRQARAGRRYGADGRGGGGALLRTIVLLAAIAFGVWYFVLQDDGNSDVTPTSRRARR